MLDVMFEVPNRDDVKKIVITSDNVLGESEPNYYNDEDRKIS